MFLRFSSEEIKEQVKKYTAAPLGYYLDNFDKTSFITEY